MNSTRWHLIRHAPVVSHMRGVIYGGTDQKADTSNTPAYEKLAATLPTTGAVWITSHLSRTKDTALAIGKAGYDLPELIEDKRFGEQHFGNWHGRTHADLEAEKGDGYHRFWVISAEETPPGGESFLDLRARVTEALEEYTERFSGQNIICVCHGGPIRACLGYALGLTAENALHFYAGNLSVSRIEKLHPEPGFAGGWRVTGVNIPPV